MIKLKVLTATITFLLIVASITGCSGSKSAGIVRTIVSERLVTKIDSLRTLSPLIYSPDVRRVAYIAEKEGKRFAVVDGIYGKGYSSIDINFRTFSPDSKRIAYIAIVYGEKPPVGNKWFVVVDGEEGDEYQTAGYVTFSPDSKHVAYMANGVVFMDRVQAQNPLGIGKISSLIFSPDSQHLAYIIELAGKQSVVLDGVPGKGYDKIGTIVFSLDSKHLAYRARIGNTWSLVIDGRDERQYEAGEVDYDPIVFSPDSNHMAYVVHEGYGTPANIYYVVVDGIEGKRYKSIGSLIFSSDGNHLAYVAGDEKNLYIIMDGEEKEKPRTSVFSLTLSPDSKRLAYIGAKTGMWGNTTASWVVVDGKSYKKYKTVGDITFSPDGKHIAYSGVNGEKMFIIIDETIGKEYTFLGRGFGGSVGPSPDLKRIIFDSADSFHYLTQRENSIYLVEETFK